MYVFIVKDTAFDFILAMEEDNVTSLRKDYLISEKVRRKKQEKK